MGVASLAFGLAMAGVVYWFYGVPFDGWSRSEEKQFLSRCEEIELVPKSFCECMLHQFKKADMGADEVNRRTGAAAGFACGFQGEL